MRYSLCSRANPFRPVIVGIVNVSPESFSDGAAVGEPAADAQRALALLDEGADFIELGAASSHPDAREIGETEEIDRLGPVLELLVDHKIRVGVDTWKPGVQRYALRERIAFLNDIGGFGDPGLYRELAASACELVVMHSVQGAGKATRCPQPSAGMLPAVRAFFDQRAVALTAAGIARRRIVADPGMGFFLGDSAKPSIDLLKALSSLDAELGLPLLVSVSRKSFLGELTGRPVAERGSATLAAELYAAAHGASAIRTHDVRALSDALTITRALADDDDGDRE